MGFGVVLLEYFIPRSNSLIYSVAICVGVAEVELCLCVGFGVVLLEYFIPRSNSLFEVSVVFVSVAEVELRPSVT